MSTITTYQELKVAIQNYAKRSDILSMLDTFIDLAEVDIWAALRVREMEANATATMGTSDRFETLPLGFIKMRRLQLVADGLYCDLDSRDLKNMRIISEPGIPFEYTITDVIEFNRVPDDNYQLEMQYFRELTPLTASTPENDILTNHVRNGVFERNAGL